jgi:hypothetical protein
LVQIPIDLERKVILTTPIFLEKIEQVLRLKINQKILSVAMKIIQKVVEFF